MKKYQRAVFIINPANEQTIRVVGLESDVPISAGDALDTAAKHMEEIAPGQPRHLKIYCGGIDKADSDARTRIDEIKTKLTGGAN